MQGETQLVLVSGWRGSGKDTLAALAAELRPKGSVQRLAFADYLKERVAALVKVPLETYHDVSRKDRALLDRPYDVSDAWAERTLELIGPELIDAEGRKLAVGERAVVIDIPAPVRAQALNPTTRRVAARPVASSTSSSLLGGAGQQPGVAEVLYWSPRAQLIFYGSSMRALDSRFWVTALVERVRQLAADGVRLVLITDFRYATEHAAIADCLARAHDAQHEHERKGGADHHKRAGAVRVSTLRIDRFGAPQSLDASERDLDNYRFDMRLANRGSLDDLRESVVALLAQLVPAPPPLAPPAPCPFVYQRATTAATTSSVAKAGGCS